MKTLKLFVAVAFVATLSACASTSSTANRGSHGQFGQCQTQQSGRVCAKVVIVDNN